MKRTPLKRGTKTLKRSGFKRKPKILPLREATVAQDASKPLKTTKPRRKKSNLAKLKIKLWSLCREMAFILYPHSCYTCDVFLTKGSPIMQLGHFIPKSTCSTELKYDMSNLRWQCRYCNQFRNGMWTEFERRLIAKEGQEYVDTLKRRDYETRGGMYREEWYEAKIEEYQNILNELLTNRN